MLAVLKQACQQHRSLPNEGVQQIYQIIVGHFADVKFTTFTARNAVNNVGGGACKIVQYNEIGFRS